MKNRAHRSWRLLALCAALAASMAPCRADESREPDAAPSARVAAPNAVSALDWQREGAAEIAAVPRDVPLVASRDAVPPESVPAAASTRWLTSAELNGHAYRFSLARGELDLGMTFDTPTRASHPQDVRIDAQGPVLSTLPSVSLGLHHAHELPASSLLARATAAAKPDSESRVGIQWQPAQSQVNFLREGLGMRLDSNESITMRLRKGLFGVYLQRRF